MTKELNYLRRLYLNYSPNNLNNNLNFNQLLNSINFGDDDDENDSNLSQMYLIKHLIGPSSKLNEINSWKKLFWNKIISKIDEIEINELILNQFLLNLNYESNSIQIRTKLYEWSTQFNTNVQSITLKEESKVISSGTTGLITWQAGRYFSNHLIANSNILFGTNDNSSTTTTSSTILELGSGIGLLTLVVAKLLDNHTTTTTTTTEKEKEGKRKIIGTDVDDLVLERLKENVKLNKLEDRVQITPLDWELALSSQNDNDDSLMLEWEKTTFGSNLSEDRPLLILGSDITYDPILAEPLIATLYFLLRPLLISSSSSSPPTSSNLNPKQPEAFLSITIRIESTFANFLNLCQKKGLKIEEIELSTLNKPGEEGIVGCEGWENEGLVKLIRIIRV